MIKTLLAVATVVALSACSSGSSTPAAEGGNTNPPENTPQNPPANAPTGGGQPPASESKAGAYLGDFGSGQGVYVINNDNSLMGLALSADGSANSLFGDIGTGSTFNGELRGHIHEASVAANQGVFGAGRVAEPATTTFNLNIVNQQSIDSLAAPAVSASYSTDDLTPATAAALAGSWSGSHRFCGADVNNCDSLVTEITFSGTDITGRTFVSKATGEEVFPNVIGGGITEFGDVVLVSFIWNANTYNGIAFFAPGRTGELVFIGETQGESDNKTIATLLTK